MESRKQIQRLLQDSILNLCKASLDAGCHFEVDGIICITSPKDDQQIVVKMHEFINTPNDVPSSGSHSQSNRSSTHVTYGTRGTGTVAHSRGHGHGHTHSETLAQVLTTPSQKQDDDGGKHKKVKIFEIIDEPVETEPAPEETSLLWSSADVSMEGEEFEVLTDDNIPQEVELAVSKVMGSASKRSSAGASLSLCTSSPSAGIVKKAKVTVAHPNKNSPITGPGPYVCAGCERQFNTRTSLSLHVVKKHSSYAMVYCGACQTGFIDRKTFSAHSCVQSHPTTEVVDPENDFTDQGGNLDVHSNTMLKSLLTAERMGARLRHADSVASRQPYVIDETDALLNERSLSPASAVELEQTSRPNSASPSDDQNHNECTVCSKVFEIFEDLETHCWKAHKRYPCHHCYKTFTEKYTRERHYRIHTGVKPFHCGSCQRGFTRRDHLRTHCDNTHGYPTHLFDLNYKGGEFTPPTDGGAPELDIDAEVDADADADAITLSSETSPAVQFVDEFIPLDDVNQEEEGALTYTASVDDTALPVFPMPTEIDHQAEWEEETSSTGPGALSEAVQEDAGMTNGDMRLGTTKEEPEEIL